MANFVIRHCWCYLFHISNVFCVIVSLIIDVFRSIYYVFTLCLATVLKIKYIESSIILLILRINDRIISFSINLHSFIKLIWYFVKLIMLLVHFMRIIKLKISFKSQCYNSTCFQFFQASHNNSCCFFFGTSDYLFWDIYIPISFLIAIKILLFNQTVI